MEEIDKIQQFLTVDEYGSGSGYGYGSGSGSGSGYGSGYGSGDGDGVESIGGHKVYQVDDTPTLIYGVHGDYAIGGILRSDLTVVACFIAKKGNFFAHGETLHEAFDAVNEKWSENRPLEERIADFNRKYPDRNVKVPASELFSWHHILTGSCMAGRKEFCREHGLDYENGEYTVNEFIGLTRNAYGGEAIRELEQSKKCCNGKRQVEDS